jgi:hypothetical protein
MQALIFFPDTMNLLLSLLPIANLLLSIFNYKHDKSTGGWQKPRRNTSSVDCVKDGNCLTEKGSLSDFSILSLQILVVILQATLAINLNR